MHRKRYRLFLYLFLRSVVCLSVYRLSHSYPCLDRQSDLDAIWQVHLWGPVRHCVKWESLTPRGRGDLGVEPPAKACSLAKPSVLFIRPPGTVVPGGLIFCCGFFLWHFAALYLQDGWGDRPETFTHDWKCAPLDFGGLKFGGPPPPKKSWG